MRSKLLLFTLSIMVLVGCSTAYKTGQTPDDVYYSPARYTASSDDNNRKEEPRIDPEDREIRMAINDYRWRLLDYDYYDYSYNPYRYAYTYGYYYNPYYCHTPVYYYAPTKPVVPTNSTPRMVNLNTYTSGYNNSNTVSNPKFTPTKNNVKYNTRNYQYNNNSTSSSSNASSGTNRTYTPSSSSSSSSSSGSSGSGTISRPAKTGR